MTMNIIERNFYRLLRSGAFGTEEVIEPMSVWKWGRLYHLSEMHDVAMYIYKGIEHCSDQFFVQIPQELNEQWRQAATEEASASAEAVEETAAAGPDAEEEVAADCTSSAEDEVSSEEVSNETTSTDTITEN